MSSFRLARWTTKMNPFEEYRFAARNTHTALQPATTSTSVGLVAAAATDSNRSSPLTADTPSSTARHKRRIHSGDAAAALATPKRRGNKPVAAPTAKQQPGKQQQQQHNDRAPQTPQQGARQPAAVQLPPGGVPEKLGDQPLRLIIIGHNPSAHAWASTHFYSNPSNRMWPLLISTGIAPPGIRGPVDDGLMPGTAGVGFTDVGTGHPGTDSSQFSSDFIRSTWLPSFYSRLTQHLRTASDTIGCVCGRCGAPCIVAFSGKRQYLELLNAEPPFTSPLLPPPQPQPPSQPQPGVSTGPLQQQTQQQQQLQNGNPQAPAAASSWAAVAAADATVAAVAATAATPTAATASAVAVPKAATVPPPAPALPSFSCGLPAQQPLSPSSSIPAFQSTTTSTTTTGILGTGPSASSSKRGGRGGGGRQKKITAVPFGKQDQLPPGWPLPHTTEVWVLTSTSGASALTNEQRAAPYEALAKRLREIPWPRGVKPACKQTV